LLILIKKLCPILTINDPFLTSITQFGFSNTPKQNSIFDAMNYSEVIKMTLEFDLAEVTGDVRNAKKHPAVLRFLNKEGEQLNWNTKVSLRGKFRRMKCTGMLPLKVDFKKKELKEAGMSTFDDLKLVPLCIEDQEMAKEWLLKEYLAYKLYNELTDASFRVQLVEITYMDSKTTSQNTQFAFFIEDTAQLRNRLGGAKVENSFGHPWESFNHDQMKTMALFQYMIGNADWDINVSRNIKMIKQGTQLMAIPYDFDFSGLVNAKYAVPNRSKHIRTVEERVYLGFEKDLEGQDQTIQLFQKNRKNIIQTIKDFKLLRKHSRKEMVKYVHSFYDKIEDIKTPQILEKELIEKQENYETALR